VSANSCTCDFVSQVDSLPYVTEHILTIVDSYRSKLKESSENLARFSKIGICFWGKKFFPDILFVGGLCS
jgi:hypothetical protein